MAICTDETDSIPSRSLMTAKPIRFLHYELLELLGSGGMGLVYRARDMRLGRTVALKFLPSAPPPSAHAKMRFLCEARAAAALDHPNICTIYESGETAAGQIYLAMACYEGESLKSRLARGPLTAAEALQIALQVTRGLAQAHRQGIVHRDIKPANLMITTDGLVKIVDFGIARFPGQDSRYLPGTPAYTPPEQARGAEVDARSDLWSLGVVLHEMLTGHRPAAGGTTPAPPGPPANRDGGDTYATGGPLFRPPPAPRLSRELPPGLGNVLARLLAHDPRQRYADATALLADLTALAGVAGSGPHPPRRGARRRQASTALAAAGALAIAGGVYLWRSDSLQTRDEPPPRPQAFRPLTDLPGRECFPALAPDGASFCYAKLIGERSHLFLKRVAGGPALDLSADSPGDDTQPAFSPDGRWLAFRSERGGGGIFLMQLGSTVPGAVRRLTDFGYNPAWSPNGRDILCATEGILLPRTRRHPSRVYRVEVATGRRRLVLAEDAVQPAWSPHGSRIAFWQVSAAGDRSLWTARADGRDRARVTDGRSVDWNPVWSPDGRFLYYASDRSGVPNLWRVRIDEDAGRVLSPPEPVTASSQAVMQPSIAASGLRIAYAGYETHSFLEQVAFDPAHGAAAGSPGIVDQTSQGIHACDASPDGRWLVFQTTVPEEDLFLIHPDGSGRHLLAGETFRNRLPRWSPDSSRVAFYSNRGGSYEVWTAGAAGGRPEPATALHDALLSHPIWSPDGRQLAIDLGANEALLDLAKPLAERHAVLLPPAGADLGFSASSWSADGRWLAGSLHRADGARLPGIVLYAVSSGRYRRLAAACECPAWLADGRHLLCIEGRHIAFIDVASGRMQRALTAPPGSEFDDLSLSADNRTLYVVRVAEAGDIWMMTLR
jgi:Tol biopolymer transport system component